MKEIECDREKEKGTRGDGVEINSVSLMIRR